jgi:hypothetical protein
VPKLSPAEIDSLPLHDAVLGSIEVSWESAQCTIQIVAKGMELDVL